MSERLVKMIPFHWARPRSACDKCMKLAEEGGKYCLISFQFSTEEMARPMMTIDINGEEVLIEFDLVKTFKDEGEAREYSIENSLDMPKS